MTPETPTTATEELAVVQEPGGRSVGWQLLQVAAIAALLLVGMYEVDLDAKALAERRARSAVLGAVEEAAKRTATSVDPELERAVEAYAKVCLECATTRRCAEAIHGMRVERKAPVGRGPCKEPIFERWNADE